MSSDGGVHFHTTHAGQWHVTLNGVKYNAFCVDDRHTIAFPDSYTANTSFHVTDPSGPIVGSYYQGGMSSAMSNGDLANISAAVATQRADEVAYLTDHYLNVSAAAFAGGASGSTNFKDNMAAINLSIWDIVTDGGDGLSSGNLIGNAATIAKYGGMVTYYDSLAANWKGYKSNSVNWIQAPLNRQLGHKQDFDFATPEGSSLALMCPTLGIGALFGLRRLRKKRS